MKTVDKSVSYTFIMVVSCFHMIFWNINMNILIKMNIMKIFSHLNMRKKGFLLM